MRYELLDCNHTFLESVNKLVTLMETGMVKGAETLVPHLFQFLVMLAYDSSKLVTIPHVSYYIDCDILLYAIGGYSVSSLCTYMYM